MNKQIVAIATALLLHAQDVTAFDTIKSVGRQVEQSRFSYLSTIKVSPVSNEQTRVAADHFVSATDRAFARLEKENLLDAKFGAYKIHWAEIKPAFEKDPTNLIALERVDNFGAQMIQATTAPSSCTIVIATSKGEGALIHYAKAHDAELGRPFRQLAGLSTLIYELERAEYRFKAYRGSKETGASGVVACTNRGPVKIVIPE